MSNLLPLRHHGAHLDGGDSGIPDGLIQRGGRPTGRGTAPNACTRAWTT
ncbi:MAG: hypothetical protein V1767_01170 [Chloroflexota bacterium]